MGLEVDDATLDTTAQALRGGHADVEHGAAPPPVAQAGPCTGLIAGVTGMLCESLGVVSDGMACAGDAVASGREVYGDTEAGNTTELGGRIHQQN